MKNRLENLEKKIVASDRNQPRIYLTKQEVQAFDLARSIFVTIEQEDYPLIDAEIIELFNQKLDAWKGDHASNPPKDLELYVNQLMMVHNFAQVARNLENIAFARNGKYLTWSTSAGFRSDLQWLKVGISRSNFVLDSADWQEMPNFDAIMKDLYAGGMVISGLVALEDGRIFYHSPDWNVEPDNVKQCIYDWQYKNRWVKLQDMRYSMVFSQPDYFSAVNSQNKTWLVGAATPMGQGNQYFVLGLTAPGTDGKNAYVDVARAANMMKKKPDSKPSPEVSEQPSPLVKEEYEFMIALEKQLDMTIPVKDKVDNASFGCIIVAKHVVVLALFGKKLAELPETLGNLSQLQELYINSNYLTKLPESIGKLKRLSVLNANSNRITALPEGIVNLTALKSLHLYSNRIAALPTSIGNLTALKTLWLQENKLTSIPESIGQLQALAVLNLRDNQLTELPATIGQLKALKSLMLNGNPMTAIPDSIGDLTTLEELGLNFDQPELIPLPESLLKLTALKSLDLAMVSPSKLSATSKKVLKMFESQGCIELPFMLNQIMDKGKNKLKELEENIIIAWESLSTTKWDEEKKTEIVGWIKTREPYIIGVKKIQDIKYRLVQNGFEYKRINEWQAIDDQKDPEFALKSLVELHDHLLSREDLVHPAIWAYFRECIEIKSKKFQEKIPFTWS